MTAAVAALLTAAGCADAQSNGPAAVVNGRLITRSEVDEYVKVQIAQVKARIPDPREQASAIAKLRATALDELIERELILDEYAKLSNNAPIQKQYVDADIKSFVRETYQGDYKKFLAGLAEYPMSLQKFREIREKMLILQMMRQMNAKDSGMITPEKKAKFIKEHPELFHENSMVKLRSITIPKVAQDPLSTPASQRKLAYEIRQRLVKGADFASEAKTYSEDSHRDAGGSWGGPIDRKALSAPAAAVIFALKPNTISEVIEETDNYYIFLVEAKIIGKMLPAEKVEEMANNFVKIEEKRKANEQWVARLKSKATIKYFGSAPSSTPVKQAKPASSATSTAQR